MDRVQIAAIAGAVALFVLWFVLLPTTPPPGTGTPPAEEPRAEAPAPPDAATPAPSPAAEAALPPQAPPSDAPRHEATTQAARVVLENDAVRIRVSTRGGRVESVQLKGFRDRIGPDHHPVELVTSDRGTLVMFLGDGPLAELEQTVHQIAHRSPRSVELVTDSGGVLVRRTLTLDERGYGAWLRVRLENKSDEPILPSFQLAMYGVERPSAAPDHFLNYSLVTSADGKIKRARLSGLGRPGLLGSLFGRSSSDGERFPAPVEWAGVDSQYFLLAAVPENPKESTALQRPIGDDAGMELVSYPRFEVPSQRYVERVYRIFVGPKIAEEVAAVDPRLADAARVGYAIFAPLVHLFAVMLVWTHTNVVANYGVAIILLTILLRLATYPLTQRSMKSMQRFSEISGPMKELQEKHKGDREKLNAEMMALYKRTGINPITAMGGGCLPMLIQFPFLIALYFALQGSIELRHAPFIFWIKDLSAPENLYAVAGIPIRVLPLMMGATMVLQNRLTPTATADPQQRQMMMWMSVFFIFLFYGFPSGLVLYWFVSNLLGIAQQTLVKWQAAKSEAAA